jgi:hypothetical protein
VDDRSAWFPVLKSFRDKQATLASVPWGFVAPHEHQALLNHRQSLETLARRGGLSASELLAVVQDRAWKPESTLVAEGVLRELLAAWGLAKGHDVKGLER